MRLSDLLLLLVLMATGFALEALDNPNLEDAVRNFVEDWRQRHNQNVDYNLEIRSERDKRSVMDLPLENTDEENEENLQNDLNTYRERGYLMSAITNGEIIPEHMRPQVPQRPGFTPPPEDTSTRQCPTCHSNRESDKELRIAMIQQQILKRLGLKKPPQVNVTDAALENLLPLGQLLPPSRMPMEYGYEDEDYMSSGDDTAQVLRLISFGERLPDEKRQGRTVTQQACYFDIMKDNHKTRVVRAKLWVYLRPAVMTRSNSCQLDIYRLGPPMYADGPLSGFNVLTRRIQPRSSGGWESFDIKSVIRGWIRNPDSMYGLQVEAVDDEGNDLPVMIPRNQHEQKFKPIIELRFTDIRTRQKRRTEEHCAEHQNVTRCCLYPLIVDFAQMGWNFILNPRTYKANYCSGECPHIYKQNFQHTHVVQQAYAAKKPCCAPKAMKAVSFLYYYSNGNIVYGKVPDMKVESCKCV